LSNTGLVSETELLITLRISAAAFCCSSASCVSLNSRAFWIAITAWSAKVLSRLSSLSLKVAFGSRLTAIKPMPSLFHSIGVSTTEKLPWTSAALRKLGGTSGPSTTSGK